MISDARRGHVSPGIYTEEKDVTYSVQSLGITSLGLVGETLYGPAFQNVEIERWSDFVDYFGGTSTEKFKGTGYPKYGLPYIAKSYLEESRRLNVVRVLGLSGYMAGKGWVLTDPVSKKPVVILRSKASYKAVSGNPCDLPESDLPESIVKDIRVGEYSEKSWGPMCEDDDESGKKVPAPGKFSITVDVYGTNTSGGIETGNTTQLVYNVDLNPGGRNYIYNILSNRPDTGTTPIYIEALFESSYEPESSWAASGIEKYELSSSGANFIGTGESSSEAEEADNMDYTDYRSPYRAAMTPWIVSDADVKNNDEGTGVTVIGSSNDAFIRKLFRFVTISDGDAANYQVKVSVEKIDPVGKTFDVVVRDFNDTDSSAVALERFSKCNLVEGDAGYIAYKIGTSDGGYEAKSKYILVEMADSEDLKNCVPAGFIGYPMPQYGVKEKVSVGYNCEYDPSLKSKKQYFGFSSINGIETDLLSFKGKEMYSSATKENDTTRHTAGFHMDALVGLPNTKVYIDGVSGYSFESVSYEKVGTETYVPRLYDSSSYLDNSIYRDANLRKFTVCFYGGFDGWDINRESRTNTDDYKATKYALPNASAQSVFSKWAESENGNLPLNLPHTAITTDYYAYLAGYRVFANPQDIDINLFATPGINWMENTMLTEEAIDVIEDPDDGRGGDALYIMESPNTVGTTLDGTVDELASQFADSEINSSYACTYAPWVMYYDSSNRKYLDLPVTKDVVRNMAATDNDSYPWFAPAGMERGGVNCVKASLRTTLAQEDTLYENRINPVKSFAQDGVKIWGNKTAYNVESPLNRINVRRLMIRVKKLVTEAAKNLIFTQYDDTLDQQFRGLVEPILNDVKSNKGITDYRIQTEVTPEAKDQHILPARILIKPTPALEYISISFIVYPESVEFEEE